MATETQVSITRQDPAIEAYRLGLLADTQGYIKQEIAKGTLPPDFQIANLSPQQEEALTSFAYNLGTGIWEGSGILEAVNAGDFRKAGDLMKLYNKHRDPKTGQLVVNKGLQGRRNREAQMLLG